jgi:hypothetical protein
MTPTLLARRPTLVQYLLSILAFANIALFCVVAANHVSFPLNLEAMETTVLEHVRRAMTGQPIYVEASARFTPLAYNPLYYYLCAFFAKFMGLSLATLREVTLLGTAGSAWLLFRIAARETRSIWWGFMTVGLFAGSYQALDSYFDVGHRDTWLIFLVLSGCYLIGYSESRVRDAFGILLLTASFWMKQQGIVFLAGGLAYLVWRDLRLGLGEARLASKKTRIAFRSWPSALTALCFGPLLYLVLPAQWIGPEFHYFTWIVPRHWTGVTRDEIRAFAEWLARRFVVPAAIAGAGLQMSLERGRPLSVWIFFLPVAFLSALVATLTPGSNLNVFMPFGVWLILSAVITIPRLSRGIPWLDDVHFPATAIALTLAALAYNPMKVLVSEPDARIAYGDLVQYIHQLDGPVYAPWVGQLPSGSPLISAAHWVPLEDMMRGPGASPSDMDHVKQILKPALNPDGDQTGKMLYILHNSRLETDHLLNYLADSYVLEADLGDRFRALDCIPRRYSGSWPRYLYRYNPHPVPQLSAAQTRP